MEKTTTKNGDERIIKTVFGTFAVSPKSDPSMTHHLEHGTYNQSSDILLVSRFVHEKSIFLDIGAHIGTFLIPIARIAHQTHAFEPVPHTRDFLLKNITLNNLLGITVHPFGLGDEEKKLSVDVCSTDGGSNSLFKQDGPIMVDVKVLDDVVENADVIKIDVEGMEPSVLRGAKKLLHNSHPIIFCEVNDKQLIKHGSSAQELEDILRSSGYEIYLPLNEDVLGYSPALSFLTTLMNPNILTKRAKYGCTVNILCIPLGYQNPFRTRPVWYTVALLLQRQLLEKSRRFWYFVLRMFRFRK